MDRLALEYYEKQSSAVREAIGGLTREQLLAFPVPGTWSIQQIVMHLADSEAVFADRIKRVIAEENPILLAFDQDQWQAALHYNDQSAEDAALSIELIRRQLGRVLQLLPDAALLRQGMHSENGAMTLSQIVEKAVWHLDHHLKFLVDKRARLEK